MAMVVLEGPVVVFGEEGGEEKGLGSKGFEICCSKSCFCYVSISISVSFLCSELCPSLGLLVFPCPLFKQSPLFFNFL